MRAALQDSRVDRIPPRVPGSGPRQRGLQVKRWLALKRIIRDVAIEMMRELRQGASSKAASLPLSMSVLNDAMHGASPGSLRAAAGRDPGFAQAVEDDLAEGYGGTQR